jgi:4-hydroxy-tetrahydrodipicolinate reductase
MRDADAPSRSLNASADRAAAVARDAINAPPVAPSAGLIVVGARGRLGARVCALAWRDPRVRLLGAVVRDAHAGEPCVAESPDSPLFCGVSDLARFTTEIERRAHATPPASTANVAPPARSSGDTDARDVGLDAPRATNASPTRGPSVGASAAPGDVSALATASTSDGGKLRVVVDASSPQSVAMAIDVARRAGAALLVCTTGHDDQAVAMLRDEAAHRAVMLTPNTSVGVAAVSAAAALLARALPGYQVSIVEQHHIHKKDAPSGTAKRIARALRDAGAQLDDQQVMAIRAGDIVGEHTIRLSGPGETIELVHRATTRDLFALGAIRASMWLAGRAPGWYTIEQTLA